jgi:hypothetical protein
MLEWLDFQCLNTTHRTMRGDWFGAGSLASSPMMLHVFYFKTL